MTKRYFSNGLLTLMTITLLLSILLPAIPVMTTPAPAPEQDLSWPMYSHDKGLTGYTLSPAPSTNKTLWTYTTGSTLLTQPAIKDGKLYVMSADGFFYCLNTNGTLIWKTNMSDVLKAPGPRVDTHSAANAVVDGKVYGGTFHYYNASVGGTDMGACGRVFCLNAATGALIWNFTGSVTGASPYGSEFGWSPMIIDDRLYISEYAGLVYCLNATTGALIWQSANTNGVNYGMTAVADVAVGDRRIYLGGTHTDVICLNDTGGVKWSYNTGGTVWNVLVADGKVYADSQDGRVYCLDATAGTQIWNYTRPAAAYARSALSIHGDRLFFASQDKNVTCVNKNTGAFIWNYTTGGTFGYQSPPCISGDGKVLVGSGDNCLYCLNETTGALIWKYNTTDPTGGYVWGVAIADGIAFATSWNNKVYAFGTWGATTMFEAIWQGVSYWIPTISNSTLGNFNFSQQNKQISFNVTGASGTSGFCHAIIPKTLLKAEPYWNWTILLDGTDKTQDAVIVESETHTYIYFPYSHSTKTVTIRGTWVVPEFPAWAPTLLMLLALVVGAVFLRKKIRSTVKYHLTAK